MRVLGLELSKTSVGFVISIPILMIITGGAEDTFALLFMSIVCTAGIGLVAWIPIWWLLGTIFFALLRAAGWVGPDTTKRHFAPKHPESDGKIPPALTQYMRDASAAGMEWDEITKRLQDNGWKPEDIRAGRESLAAQ